MDAAPRVREARSASLDFDAIPRRVSSPKKVGARRWFATGAVGASARNKPSSVPAFRQGRIIPLGPPLPAASCGLPGTRMERAAPRPLFGLAPGGVCRASLSPGCWWALTLRSELPRHFTLTPCGAVSFCCTFPVLDPLRGPWTVGVTHHPVLWSPDFPPTTASSNQRLSGRLVNISSILSSPDIWIWIT